MSPCDGRDGVEPGPEEVGLIRARDQESALQIPPTNTQLVRPTSPTPSYCGRFQSGTGRAPGVGQLFQRCRLCCRRSPRVRHGLSKPRPSSVELTTDLRDLSEGEDVFYTYRVSLNSSRGSDGDTPPQRSVCYQEHKDSTQDRGCHSMILSVSPPRLALSLCLSP